MIGSGCIAPVQRAALALAIIALVAPSIEAERERDRGDLARERGQLVGRTAVISVAVGPQDELREHRVARVEYAVAIGVERSERGKAVARAAAVREHGRRAEQLGAARDRAIAVE